MSTLIVEELGLDAATELKQSMTATKDLLIKNIRPHLYRHNTAAGSVIVDIRDTASGDTIATSNTLAISSLIITGGSGLAFVHAYFNFAINANIKDGANFDIVLKSSGYTFAEGSYVGWCKDFDLRKYTAGYSPNKGFRSAFDLEIWTLEETGRERSI